jgi:aryl-alcohol dehydrogenase-like predicted oxidoreductase
MNMPSVTLAGTGKSTTQLGFGCAYLLGRGVGRTESLRILEAAHAAGIRHFDVAPAYGHGFTEALLGEFLRRHGEEVTVTTKYGLHPASSAERFSRSVFRRVPGLSRLLPEPKRRRASYLVADVRRSLEQSLRRFGRRRIDLLLLHEPRLEDLAHEAVREFLEAQRQAGTIGDYGVGGEHTTMPAIYQQRRAYCRVMQFDWSVINTSEQFNFPGAYHIHYRTFAPAARVLEKKFAADPAMAGRWSQAIGLDLKEPGRLKQVLLRASLDRFPGSVALFSTQTAGHIAENVRIAGDDSLKAPAARLQALVEREFPPAEATAGPAR